MLSDEREGELRRLAMQIAVLVPAEREDALAALDRAQAIVEAVGVSDQAEVAKRIAGMTPSDPAEARAVLDLAREFLEYTEQRARGRLHSLRVVPGFKADETIERRR